MSPDSRLKARVKFLKGQLSVGQTLYFAPWDAYEMKEDEIRLEPVQIKHIPESGGAVKVLRANGQTCSFGINRNGRVEFHFGYLDSAPSSMAQAVFLSEERFWRWREFYRLLNELHASGIAECYFSPTDSGLKAARIVYDILENENTDYQNVSCAGWRFRRRAGRIGLFGLRPSKGPHGPVACAVTLEAHAISPVSGAFSS